MKKAKLLIVIAMACAVVMLMSGIAQANYAIHGGYLADTDACAGCHRAHTATSAVTWIDNAGSTNSALLVGPPTTQVYIFCYVCHSSDAPGAATDVEGGCLDSVSPGGAVEGANTVETWALADNTLADDLQPTLNGGGFSYLGDDVSRTVTSTHEVDGLWYDPDGPADPNSLDGDEDGWIAWGKDENVAEDIYMDCVSCHDPHGSSNYRVLKDYVNGHWVGGYQGSVTPTTSASKTAATIDGVDPDPLPFVISNEIGYPLKGSNDPYFNVPNPTNGFRLHRIYNDGDQTPGNFNGTYEYLPAYTKARYARGENATMVNQYDPNKGMSSWCCACHENYMATTSISNWALGRVANGTAVPGTPGNYPLGAGTTTVLVTTLSAPVAPGDTSIPVVDASGFPNPADPDDYYYGWDKYIAIYDPDFVELETNEGDIGVPILEIVSYDGISGDTFSVISRGAQDTDAINWSAGAYVYLCYDAGDGYGDLLRHRHPMNVPLLNWQDATSSPTWVAGDRALVIDPNDWQVFDPNVDYVDIPLDHDAGYPGVDPLSEQLTNPTSDTLREVTYEVADWIECLTCHRAHGTDATMTGFASASLTPITIEGFNTLVPDPDSSGGVPPTGDSALLRADNRGVCERCHNK